MAKIKRVLIVGASAALTACGTGEGGQITSVDSVPPPPVLGVSAPSTGTSNPPAGGWPAPVTLPSTLSFDTAEDKFSTAAIGANATAAYQAGATGQGIKIGFVDTGASVGSELKDRIVSGSGDVVGERGLTDVYGHGTGAVSIAVGNRDNRNGHGVAFEATAIVAKADTGCPSQCVFTPEAVAAGIDLVRQNGAKIINLSIGGSASSIILDAARRAVDAGMIVVVAAGNDAGQAPTPLAQSLASLSPAQVIIVGAAGRADFDGAMITYDAILPSSNLAKGYSSNFLVGSSRVDLQACKLEYSIVSPK